MLLVFLAIALFFITNSSVFAAVIPSVYAGWKTFQCGLWILKGDPNRIRGRTCFTFYIACAFWNVALTAFLTVCLFLFVANIFGIQPNMDKFAATMILLTIGVILNTIVGFYGIISAVRYEIHIWVHPNIRTCFQNNFSILSVGNNHFYGFNRAIFIVGTTLVFPLVILGGVSMAIVTSDNVANHVPTILELSISLSLIFGLPIAMIPCYAWLSSLIIAKTPQDCWPDEFVSLDN
jgi:hypothetical protein